MKIHNNALSASKIKTYLGCPFRYFLEYVLRIKSPPTFATENGTIIHSVLEKYSLGHKGNWRKELLWRYKKKRPWELLSEFKSHGECLGCQLLETLPFLHDDFFSYTDKVDITKKVYDKCPYVQIVNSPALINKVLSRSPSPFDHEIIDAEHIFTLPIGYGIAITGIIDLVSRINNDTIEIRDWKTGNYVPSYEDAFNDPQLRLYDLAASILFPEYSKRLLTFDYIKKATYTFVISDEERELNKKWIISVGKQIEKDMNPKRVLSYKCERMCMLKRCNQEWPNKLITIKKLQEEGTFK